MFDEVNIFSLHGGAYYITERENDAFRVKKGTMLVYIVPLKNGDCGRRSFIYEATSGEVVPSFCYRDIEYCEWRFCFVALEDLEVEIINNGATKILKERFANKARIKNYGIEGYNSGLVDQYRINIVTEDGFIRRSQKERVATSTNTLKIIFNSFNKKRVKTEFESSHSLLYDTVNFICTRDNINIAEFEKIREVCGENFEIYDIARISNFAYREIILVSDWYKQDLGTILIFDEKNKPYVCFQNNYGKYELYDAEDETLTPVSQKVAQILSMKAYMIYKPLPSRKLTKRDIFDFCKSSVSIKDIIMLLMLTIITSLIGLLIPTISQRLYDQYIPMGAQMILIQLGTVMASFMLSNVLFSIIKNLVSFRITSKMSYDIQSAAYNRLFSFSESFFMKYESADMAQRVMRVGSIINIVASIILNCSVALVFIIVNICKMASYSWEFTLYGILMIAIYTVCYYCILFSAIKYRNNAIELNGKSTSKMYQFIMGISKIRIAGVEDRALYEYMKPYAKLRENEFVYNNFSAIGSVLTLVSNSIFTIALYIIIIKGKTDISLGTFIAFNSVFGAFVAYAMQIVENLIQILTLKPEIERLKPLMDEVPEFNNNKEMPGEITGKIEINNVTFSYSQDSEQVLKNIHIDIKSGEYIGIVGPSGCGKSTLMKLLLGFEKPSSGKIYYDNKDIDNVDKRELRKKMGVVLQNGELISGNIFENITITSPDATEKDVNKVIKCVGLEDDIKQMPMGLNTILHEKCGTISGGQKQRILIARAIISNPKILFFDEATSALDNVTQRMVCETLEQMNLTRIVIAHRLSTIMNCDRIIVMDEGRIVEQGSYNDLMENKGMFYKLASRQMA